VEDPTNRDEPLWFSKQFRNKPVSDAFVVVKNRKPATDSEIEAITGATISSQAVVTIINQFVRDAQKIFMETV
jgi:Na+-translocating ferredoxin:NAD+ oxidoreductase RnfG subunit